MLLLAELCFRMIAVILLSDFFVWRKTWKNNVKKTKLMRRGKERGTVIQFGLMCPILLGMGWNVCHRLHWWLCADCLQKIIQMEGFWSLWNGTAPSLLLAANPAIQFMIDEALKRYFQRIYHTAVSFTVHQKTGYSCYWFAVFAHKTSGSSPHASTGIIPI